MTCSLPGLISKSFEGGRSSYSPLDITKNLKSESSSPPPLVAELTFSHSAQASQSISR